MTTVVNIRTYKGKDYILCDRRTMFGNPFKIGMDGNRAEVIEKHMHYFFGRIRMDCVFREAVAGLKDHKLGCWCEPLPCHCHTIKWWLDAGPLVKPKVLVRIINRKGNCNGDS
jgi:hypothetical protein